MEASITVPTIEDLEKLILIELLEGSECDINADYVVFMDFEGSEQFIIDVADSMFHFAINESHFAEWAHNEGHLDWCSTSINCEGELDQSEGAHEYYEFIQNNPNFLQENVKQYLIDRAVTINS